MTDEIYHLQVEGEQRGPYTRRQIDHQLNAGIISERALFVREGMEDWAPVTNLVALRRPRRKWKFRGALIAFGCFLLIMAHFFAPVALDGWRELSQTSYTERAAYWRARDAVRHQALPEGALIKFGALESAHVVLEPADSTATVELGGNVTLEGGHSHPESWKVALTFDHELKQWTATDVEKEKVRE